MMLSKKSTYPRVAGALMTALVALLVVACAPTEASAETADKVKEPTIDSFTILNGGNDTSFAQGQDIRFELSCSAPEDIAAFYTYVSTKIPYWMVAEYDEGFDLVDGSVAVVLARPDGSEVDLTDQMHITCDTTYRRLVAGTADMARAFVGNSVRGVHVAADDHINFLFTLRLNKYARIGYAQGNVVHAHIDYQRIDPEGMLAAAEREHNAMLRASSDGTVSAAKSVAAQPAAFSPAATTVTAGSVRLKTASDNVSADAAGAPIVAPLDDGRGSDLLSTPEAVKSVYSHRINITASDADTGIALAGATYRLHEDGDNTWFVEGAVWSADQNDATIVTTDDTGHASFVVIGSGNYTLVEAEPLAGYDVLTPVSISITPSVGADGGITALTASSVESVVTGTDAMSGIVDVAVRHHVHRESDAAAGNNNNNGNGSLLAHLTGRYGGRLPQTSDIIMHFEMSVILSVLALLGGLALRRRERGGMNIHRESSHGGWADATEGNDHGC